MPDNTPATFGGAGGRTIYADDVNVGYRWYNSQQVAPGFDFGYGLSYTRFQFSNLLVAPGNGGAVTVRATVTNVGHARGADVVQCYLGEPASSGEPPRQLRGFSRVSLLPGKARTVEFTLRRGDLAHWDANQHGWVVDGGTYRVWVGDSSNLANLPLTTTVEVPPAFLGSSSGPAAA
jgi:beta-glucosidase